MRLLVLGGGGFLGYHVADRAHAAGHDVTVFDREGVSEIEGVSALAGDRDGDLSALRGGEWDAVLDTFSGPDAVARTARLLSGRVGAYGYVSGISVYHPDGPDVVDEDAPLRDADPALADDSLQERSLAKLACEAAVGREFDGPVLVVRPGIMVGPRDPTDRFTWWPVRLARGGRVLAPGDPKRPAQYTDARDLASWIAGMLRSRVAGTFNAVGPGRDDSLEEVLIACARAAGNGAPELAWREEAGLRDALRDVEEEARPLWFPEDQIPFARVDSQRAEAKGLVFRPAESTARDTLGWRRGQLTELRAGVDPTLERALVDAPSVN